jgi:hypothetical protein
MANKLKIFTFNSGVKVYGKEIDGVLYPLEFRSEIACEKFSYKFFMKKIYMTPIKSFTDPKKFYLKILDGL